MNWNSHGADLLLSIKSDKPLIHHITNLVVTNDTANVTLHLGALPVMAHAIEEVAEMTAMAGALVLNIGTLSSHWIEAMMIAGRKANKLGIPIILDPVGAGATVFRTDTCFRILNELDVSVVRGNLGEVSILAGLGGEVKGVESIWAGAESVKVAKTLAKKFNLTVAITGRQDIVSDGDRAFGVDNGHEWLTTITGTGCSSTTAVAAFCAKEKDPVAGAVCALMCFGLAAELAACDAKGPASFKTAFYDSLYNLTRGQIIKGGKVVKV